MKLHEYQAKELLKQNGVNVPPGFAAHTVEDAVDARVGSRSLPGEPAEVRELWVPVPRHGRCRIQTVRCVSGMRDGGF